MFQVLRSFALLLALVLLTGAAAVDFSARSDAAAVSGHARFAPSMLARLSAAPHSGAAHVRLGSTHARLFTAQLEDGPEGEEAPVATFVQFFGDDELRSCGEFDAVPFAIADTLSPESIRHRPRYPVHVGFPTGPPAA